LRWRDSGPLRSAHAASNAPNEPKSLPPLPPLPGLPPVGTGLAALVTTVTCACADREPCVQLNAKVSVSAAGSVMTLLPLAAIGP
jgi:hypothetical protein